MSARSTGRDDLPAAFSRASRAARAATPAGSDREAAVRDVAAGVAAPALVGCVLWMLQEADRRGLRRLRFLSRDGQVLHAIARRLHRTLRTTPSARPDTVADALDLEYVHSSRLTWSLAATHADQLATAPWLLNSFMKSNAADVCARLGLPFDPFQPLMAASGVSLAADARADDPAQATALRRFLDAPEVRAAARERIDAVRPLLLAYATEHQLLAPDTGLVDAGWTGRMIGSLVQVGEAAGLSRPHVLLWGHEPRPTGWTDPDRVVAYMYDTASGHGLDLRVPDAPFLVETFCMSDHGIVSGYRPDHVTGRVAATLLSDTNPAVERWGLRVYRATLDAFCGALVDVLDTGATIDLHHDLRPLVHEVMDAFWCHPTPGEARAWASYPYDSDPAGAAVRPLGRAFDPVDGHAARGDRAWIAGSLALSSPAARRAYLACASDDELLGAPATD